MLDDQQATFELPGYGRDFFDRHHVNPVPGFICALQMTANALTGQPVKIVQFLAMSRYRCTDLVSAYVSATPLHEFADYMQAAQVDPAQARKLLDSAVEAQSTMMRKARRWLPMPVIVNLFIRSQTGWRRLAVSNLFRIRQQRLEKLGAFKGMQRDVLISTPRFTLRCRSLGGPASACRMSRTSGCTIRCCPTGPSSH